MDRPTSTRRRRLAGVLLAVFLLAMVMGPGPGMRLVNPDPGGEGPAPTVLGLPVLYAWGLLWYGVQLAVVLTAYFALWGRED